MTMPMPAGPGVPREPPSNSRRRGSGIMGVGGTGNLKPEIRNQKENRMPKGTNPKEEIFGFASFRIFFWFLVSGFEFVFARYDASPTLESSAGAGSLRSFFWLTASSGGRSSGM